MDELSGIGKSIHTYLGMSTRPVGVKLYKVGEELPSQGFDKPEKRMTYCRFVREAAKGKNYLIKVEDIDCANAEVTLGFREPKYVKIEPRINEKMAAIRLGPVEGSDIILFILNAEQVMTMSILLEGMEATFKGNMAVCGEATALVNNTGKANVTFLCNGARTFGTYETNEVVLSLPQKVFLELPSKMGKFTALSKKAREGLAQILLKIR